MLGSLLILSACAKKSLENPMGNMMLRIEVDGITTPTDLSTVRLSPITKGALPSTASSSVSNAESGYTAVFTSSQDVIDSEPTNSELSASITNHMNTINRATAPMQRGYTYRILLYNKATGVLWRTIQAASGTPVSLEVNTGATYLWYAYSYNNTDELPAPQNSSDPAVETSISKDFLYASGEIIIPPNSETDYSLPIVFDHKVTQVRIKVDATVLARFAEIQNLNVSFDNADYMKKGVFNIKGNQMNQIEVVPTETIFNEASSTNIWEASYYTVDPSVLSTYRIRINDLPVLFEGVSATMANRNLATYYGAANRPVFTSNFTSPAVGQRLSSTINLNYQVAPLRILHISNATSFGYALQQGPAWDFLNAKQNFGDLPESIVKMGSWAPGQGSWAGGNQTDNKSENWIQFLASTAGDNAIVNRLVATNTTNRPDIVILGFNVTTIRPAVATALNNYLNDKGVVVMMLQDANNANTIAFLNDLFGVSNISFNASGSGGAMYPIVGTNADDNILNGPFGDVRGRHWGEDAGTTLGMVNVPTSQATIYSYGNAINRPAIATERTTIFKHNTKSFFYIGDGGFVSYNGGTSSIICPFNYDPVAKRPLPKPYGNTQSGYTSNSLSAYNSTIMANIMAWAAKKADLEGIRQWKYAAPPTP